MFSTRLSLLFLIVLLQLSFLISANVIAARSDYCSNAPSTIAGTTLNRRTSTSLVPRADQYIWCVHGTQTYVTMKMARTLASDAALALVVNAYNSVYAHLMTAGDGLLPNGFWSSETSPLFLSVLNANNHQLTWGVWASALWGMKEFMTATNIYACNHFWVYDGIHLVGMGRLTFKRGSGRQV